MRISDWSSDVCSADLRAVAVQHPGVVGVEQRVLDPGEPGALATLDHDGVLRLDHVEERHAVDRAGRVGLRHRAIGRAWCRERVCSYVSLPAGAVSSTTQKTNEMQ